MSRYIAPAFALLVLAAGHAQAEVVDQVAAVVDREVILKSELEYQLTPLMQQAMGTTGGGLSQQDLQQALDNVLDQAIAQKIVYREALLSGVEINDGAIEERMTEIRDSFESAENFRETIESSGETLSEFRERIRVQMVTMGFASFKRREFAKEAVISEEMAREYFEANRDEFSMPVRIRARRIFLAAGPDADERARVKAQLESLRDELALGADFAELAKSVSQGPDADAGGLVGWVAPGDLVETLDDALFQLAAGEVSPVIETDFGFQLLKAEERQEAGAATLDNVRNEIEPRLREEYAAKRYEKWLDELRKRSRVRILL